MNMKIGNTTIHLNTLVRDYNEGKFPWQIKKRKRHEALQGRKEKLSEEEQREVDAYVQNTSPVTAQPIYYGSSLAPLAAIAITYGPSNRES